MLPAGSALCALGCKACTHQCTMLLPKKPTSAAEARTRHSTCEYASNKPMGHPQGGAAIEQLRQSTRAHIKVERETQGCPERLICISSAAAPGEPLCPAQEVLFCVQDRLAGLDTPEALQMVRLLNDNAASPAQSCPSCGMCSAVTLEGLATAGAACYSLRACCF